MFLLRGGEMIAAKQGDKLGGEYRLDTVAADQLIFVYLPLEERQTLIKGGR